VIVDLLPLLQSSINPPNMQPLLLLSLAHYIYMCVDSSVTLERVRIYILVVFRLKVFWPLMADRNNK
jgi:hypothetical protein